jgi:phosphohistidine phosphatase SixA
MSPLHRRPRRLLPALLLLGLVLPWALARGADAPVLAGQEGELPPGLFYPRTVFVVRHAEKGTDDPQDPSLSEKGILRAVALARVLGSARVTHLFASEYQRTRQTLLPLAEAVGHDVHVVPARDPRALLSALDNLPRNSVAVVAGHSNTVPALVAALAPSSPLAREEGALALAEDDYDRLYVVTQWGPDKGATAVELRY